MSAEERPQLSEVYTTALMLKRLGVSVLPIFPGTKEPPEGFRWGEYTRRFADASELYEWFEDKGWQIGVICGPVSGNLVVIDFDRNQFPDGGYRDWARQYPAITELPRSMTGKGRVHVFLRSSEPTDKYVIGDAGDKVEVRSGNHYVVVPPSIHPDTGEAYRWSERMPIADGIPTIDLRSIGFEPRRKSDTDGREPGTEGDPLSPDDIARIVEFVTPFWKEGQRHNLSLALAGWMAKYGVPEIDTHEVIGSLAAHERPDDRRDFLKTIATTYSRWREGIEVVGWSALTNRHAPLINKTAATQLDWLLKPRQMAYTFKKPTIGNGTSDAEPSKEPQRFRLTDTGNAERLVYRHGDIIRFNWRRDVWHIWNGQRWKEDQVGEIEQLAKATCRLITEEAEGASGELYQKTIMWAAKSEDAGKRRSMARLAQSEPGIPVMPDELDTDPWLLNVTNGTIDLRTGELFPHRKEDLITRMVETPYDPDATCPVFDAFLSQIMDGDQDLVTYIQRLVGYSLTGSTREQIMVIAYGTGANGKTTLLGTMRELLGDYAREADAESFMDKKHQGIREDIADLDGARFVTASETSDGKRLSEALVKKMTGGERLRARRLYENGYEFVPRFKPWLATNHQPIIEGTEHAIWRRIKLLPFSVTIADDRKDPDLPEKLRAEYPGILAWAVRGCLDWQKHGLPAPAASESATIAYRKSMDPIADWLDVRCTFDLTLQEPFTTLYSDYLEYCEINNDSPISRDKLGKMLTERGAGSRRGTGGTRFRTGIGLLPGGKTTRQVSLSGVTAVTQAPKSDSSDANDPVFQNTPHETNKTLVSGNPVTAVTAVTQPEIEDEDEPDF